MDSPPEMTERELLSWADATQRCLISGPVARAVKRLAADREKLRRDVEFLLREIQIVRHRRPEHN
jgi:hypothetical protein